MDKDWKRTEKEVGDHLSFLKEETLLILKDELDINDAFTDE